MCDMHVRKRNPNDNTVNAVRSQSACLCERACVRVCVRVRARTRNSAQAYRMA